MNLVEIGGYRDGLSVSPDGAYAAFATRTVNWDDDDVDHAITVLPLSGDGVGRVVAEAGGTVLDVSGGRANGAALDRAPLWSPDGQWLAYLVRRGAGVELWKVRASRGAPSFVYASDDADVVAFAWLSNGSIVARLSPSRAERDRVLEAAVARGFRIDPRLWVAYGLRPAPSSEPGPAMVIDIVHDNAARLAAPPDAARLPGAAPANDIVRPIDADDAAYQPAQGVFSGRRRCTAAACSGALGDAWTIGERIYFLRHEGFAATETALYEWTPHTNAVRLVRRAEDVLRACTPVEARLICFREASLLPRHVVSIDLADGHQRVLHQPNPGWSQRALTPIERIDVVDSYGNESFAYLVYPDQYEATRTYPAVIVQYRARGFLNAGVGGEAPIHAFASCGYFVFAVERPEPIELQQSLTFEDYQRQTELTNSEQQSKLSAIERILDNAASRGLIDPERVAITGLSDGAETLYWGLIHSDRFAAAVAFSPPQDPLVWPLMAEDFRHAQRRSAGISAYDDDATPEWRHWWEAISPSLNLDRLHAPLLLELGETEALQALQLYTGLRDRGRAVEAYIYPGAGHIKWRPRHILASRQRAMAWIDFWLKGEIRADADDPDRAARWAALRAAN